MPRVEVSEQTDKGKTKTTIFIVDVKHFFVAKEEGVKQEGKQKVSIEVFLLFLPIDTTNNLIIQTQPGTEEILIRGESQ